MRLPALVTSAIGLPILLITAAQAPATTWDAAADFNTAANPSAPWSYGQLSPSGSSFALLPTKTSDNGMTGWGPAATSYPDVTRNTSGGTLFYTGNGVIPAGAVTVSAGASGELGSVRWTAPVDGSYSLAVTFTGVYDNSVGTDAAADVFVNGAPAFAATILHRGSATYQQTRFLPAGASIDLAIGWGPDSNSGWDRVIVSGNVATVLTGDANLDGHLDADDFALTDRGHANGLSGWANGDFNADGHVDSADYLLLDSTYAATVGPPSPGFLATRAAQFGPAYGVQLLASVPEPLTALPTSALLAGASLARRRRP